MPFQVGDRVRAVDASCGWGLVRYGDIGTVSYVSPGFPEYRVNFPRQSHWNAGESDLRPAEEVKRVKVAKIKGVRMKAALKEAIETIKKAGFSHIKVELEGDIGRDGNRECDSCEGSGREDCDSCGGEGYIDSGITTRISEETVMEECNDCSGEGRMDCDSCEGSGNAGSYTDEDDCDSFIKDYMREHYPEARNRLTYGNFYEDGSVDSEFTFTLPIEYVTDVPLWMEAFKVLGEEVGDGIDVSGAGLHISILPEESNGSYPCVEGTLPDDKVENFKNEVTKLLPALFFLASSGHQSRDLGYRHASIGGDKYHAISHHDQSCFEFRVFETCYDKPESFYDYVQVIANTLKFYVDPSLKVKALGKQFGFTHGDECARFYNTPQQLRILNATVKHLKPRDKSFKKLKEERGVRYTIKSLVSKEKARIQSLREDYREYRQRWIEVNSRPLTEAEETEVDRLMTWENYTRRNAEQIVKGIDGRLITLGDFINKNLQQTSFEETVSV